MDKETIESALSVLAKERPVFHSEADFQHHLAWQLHLAGHHPRLEVPAMVDGASLEVDLLFPYKKVAIELKYPTKKWNGAFQLEMYNLKNHGAHDLLRYDFCYDISRIERLIGAGIVNSGFAIFVTNDSSYWKTAKKKGTADAMYRISEGSVLAGRLEWGERASPGTRKNRAEPIVLNGSYELRWKEFSKIGKGLMYLLVEIQK